MLVIGKQIHCHQNMGQKCLTIYANNLLKISHLNFSFIKLPTINFFAQQILILAI